MSMMEELDRVAARKAEILALTPESAHEAVRFEARFQQNTRGGRYLSHLEEAVRNYRSGGHFDSPTARRILASEK